LKDFKEVAIKECECQEKAKADYEANRQQCEWMEEGDEKERCEKEMREIYAEAVAECTPREVPAACVDFQVSDGLDRFNEIQLNSHNAFRGGHQNTTNMTYNVDLAFQAYEYACHLATVVKRLQHSSSADRPNQGENLYW
jgi:hypothetical protein